MLSRQFPVMETAPCAICGETQKLAVSRRDRHRKPLTTVLCTGCGIVHNWPIPDDDTLARFYSEKYRREYKGTAVIRTRTLVRNFERTLWFFNAYWPIMRAARSCIDVGSGNGEFLYFARALGMDATGIEPDIAAAEFSRDQLGLEVATTFIEDSEFGKGAAGMLRLYHVLEHLNDPVGKLKTLRGWLADDGILCISVPNIEAETESKWRGRMFHFGHIYNFNPRSLRACAGRAGFEEVESLRKSHRNQTTTFFRKARPWSAAKARDEQNAARLKDRFQAHYSPLRFAISAKKLRGKVKNAAREASTGLQLSDPGAIGRHFVARFQEMQGNKPRPAH